MRCGWILVDVVCSDVGFCLVGGFIVCFMILFFVLTVGSKVSVYLFGWLSDWEAGRIASWSIVSSYGGWLSDCFVWWFVC